MTAKEYYKHLDDTTETIRLFRKQLQVDIHQRRELENENKIPRHENAQNRELIAWIAERTKENGVML